MTTPNSRLGIDRPCPTCMSPAGTHCYSASGRRLKVTHDSRARAAMDAEPMRAWLAEQMSWRTA